ncbi:MAG: family 78 glycoside hydrolase catalytic domain [Prevotella sp.]
MKKTIFLILLLLLQVAVAVAGIRPVRLTCEHLSNPRVIDKVQPRLSWVNVAGKNENGQRQTAFQIQVASTPGLLRKGRPDLWDSGRCASTQNYLVAYGGRRLTSMQDCYWRVRVWDRQGKPSAWSETAEWHVGLLDESEWKAEWIGAPWQGEEPTAGTDLKDGSAPLLRKDFNLSKPVKSARIYITGVGYYELYLNGEKVGDEVLMPNQTDYGLREKMPTGILLENKFRGFRVLYTAYDLTHLLRNGQNVLGCWLGNGFYNSVNRFTCPYGMPRMIAQLHIVYKDGTTETVKSDTSWKAKPSGIVENSIFGGEHYDATLADSHWCTPGTALQGWQQAVVKKAPGGRLEAQMSPGDRVTERLKPVSIRKRDDGVYVVDFGKEISGWVHLQNMRGTRGQKISITHVCESPVGSNSYVMNGEGVEDYHARFTWFTFRTVEISGWPGVLDGSQVVAEAVNTDIPETARFACSDTLLNKINEIWKRALLDNAHGCIFSDCPHRERSAYTGDGQASCETVMHNFGTQAFFAKWVRDMNLAQNPGSGIVPNGAPWQPGCGGGPAWGAAIVVIPYTYFLQYGDTAMLTDNYEAMKAQVRYFRNWTDRDGIMFQRIWAGNEVCYWSNLGEWCTPTATMPDESLVHTYVFYGCLDKLARIAAILGHKDDAETYRKEALHTWNGFHRRFFNAESGSYGPAGSNLFALDMGLPEGRLPIVRNAIRRDLEESGGHLYTGIYGTRLLFQKLSELGMTEEAYTALTKKDFPSFGWWIEQGATTTWEQWDGGNSHNHHMFGGGLVWFYKKLVGIEVDEKRPGYRHFTVTPHIPNAVSWAAYETETAYGRVAARWERHDGQLSLEVDVPVECSATVSMPSQQGTAVVHEVEAGHHKFVCEWR